LIDAFELRIDHTRMNGLPIGFHFQRDPWPGGHRYSLRSTHPNALVIASFVGEGNDIQLSEEQQKRIFSGLDVLISGLPERSRPEYMLNSISSISLNADRIVLVGDCSVIS
jgi:hypothetical protein